MQSTSTISNHRWCGQCTTGRRTTRERPVIGKYGVDGFAQVYKTGFITNCRCRKVGCNSNFYIFANFFVAIAFFAKHCTNFISAGIFILMGDVDTISLMTISKIPVHITQSCCRTGRPCKAYRVTKCIGEVYCVIGYTRTCIARNFNYPNGISIFFAGCVAQGYSAVIPTGICNSKYG